MPDKKTPTLVDPNALKLSKDAGATLGSNPSLAIEPLRAQGVEASEGDVGEGLSLLEQIAKSRKKRDEFLRQAAEPEKMPLSHAVALGLTNLAITGIGGALGGLEGVGIGAKAAAQYTGQQQSAFQAEADRRQKAKLAQAQVATGDIGEDIATAKLQQAEREALEKQKWEKEKFERGESGKLQRTKILATGKGQEAFLKKKGATLGEEVAKWPTQKPKLESKIKFLESAINKMSKSNYYTGPVMALTPKVAKQEAANLQAQIEKILQEDIKTYLDARFTEKEGELFLQRGFDPSLQEKFNIERLKRTVEVLKNIKSAKEHMSQYAKEHNGDMSQYDGPDPTDLALQYAYGADTTPPTQDKIIRTLEKDGKLFYQLDNGSIVEVE